MGNLIIVDNELRDVLDKKIKEVTIPEGVTAILGEEYFNHSINKNIFKIPFEDCLELEKIILPSTLEFFNYNTFEYSLKLSCLLVDDNNKFYKTIDGVLFNKELTKLIKYPINKSGETYIVPSTVTEIGPRAFNSCLNLVDVQLPNNLQIINKEAFSACEKLITLNIPNTIEYIDSTSLSYCKSLQTININNNDLYKTIDGVLYNKELTKLIKYPQQKSDIKYTLPNSVVEIGCEAFTNCQYLEEVTLNEGLILIEDGNFTRGKLHTINISSTVENIGYEFLSTTKYLQTINVSPQSKTFKGINGVLYECDLKTLLVYPSAKKDKKVTVDCNIAHNAFLICPNIEEVNITEGVEYIGMRNFSFCTNLKTINVPSTVTHIDFFALEVHNTAKINLSTKNRFYRLYKNRIFKY